MKLLVPFRIARISITWLAVIAAPRTWMIGIPPATAASKAIAFPASRAAANSSGPCSHRRALLAVTTFFPALSSFQDELAGGAEGADELDHDIDVRRADEREGVVGQHPRRRGGPGLADVADGGPNELNRPPGPLLHPGSVFHQDPRHSRRRRFPFRSTRLAGWAAMSVTLQICRKPRKRPTRKHGSRLTAGACTSSDAAQSRPGRLPPGTVRDFEPADFNGGGGEQGNAPGPGGLSPVVDRPSCRIRQEKGASGASRNWESQN